MVTLNDNHATSALSWPVWRRDMTGARLGTPSRPALVRPPLPDRAAFERPRAANAASCAEALLSNSKLSRFSAIVQQAGLAPQLAAGTLTVFAPTNDALNGISSITQMLGGQSANAQPDFPKLQTLVRAHLVQGAAPGERNARQGDALDPCWDVPGH